MTEKLLECSWFPKRAPIQYNGTTCQCHCFQSLAKFFILYQQISVIFIPNQNRFFQGTVLAPPLFFLNINNPLAATSNSIHSYSHDNMNYIVIAKQFVLISRKILEKYHGIFGHFIHHSVCT